MCIRDRMVVVLIYQSDFAKVLDTWLVTLVGWVSTWGGIMPVSYTHLRAHETVLDLVCRLLLEKKKN